MAVSDSSEKEPAEPLQKVQDAARAEVAPRSARRRRTVLFQGVLLAAIAGFSLLAFLASSSAYFPIDLVITQSFQVFHPTWFDGLMRAISAPGYTFPAIIVVAVFATLLYYFGLHWEMAMSLLVAGSIEALNYLVKTIVHRPRPAENIVRVFQNLSSYSFPSGHVMFYTAYFGFLFFLVYRNMKHSWRRTALMVLFGGLIVSVGPSRIFLGEHWASDVIGGYLLGSLGLVAAVRVYQWGKPRFFDRQPTAPEPEKQAR